MIDTFGPGASDFRAYPHAQRWVLMYDCGLNTCFKTSVTGAFDAILVAGEAKPKEASEATT